MDDVFDDTIPTSRTTADLLGHHEAEQTLLETFNSGRMPHAWLICGPKGIGKATLAYRFARFVLVHGKKDEVDAGPGLFGEDLPSETPDNLYVSPDNPVFHRISAGGHADLMAIERELDEKKGKRKNNILIEQVRGLGGFFSLTAAEGGWRVAIIDAADEMNVNAANAVLKTLEEPPERALLLLISHSPGRLLPTIRSRCRRLVLKPLEFDILSGLLSQHRPDLSPGDVQAIAHLSDGSIGHALTLAEQGGLALYRDMMQLLARLPDLDILELHKMSDQLAKTGAEEAFATVGELLKGWLNRLIIGAAGKAEELPDEEKALIERLVAGRPLEPWLEVWEKIGHLLDRTTAVNLDRKQVVLNIFLALQGAARS